MAMIIMHISTEAAMIMKVRDIKNLTIFAFALIALTSCALAPGMYINKTTQDGIQKVYIEGASREYIPVEKITEELVQNLQKDTGVSIPSELISYKPSEYKIGNGDILVISVWGPEELFPKNLQQRGSPLSERVVRADGSIFYPYVGIVRAAGKTREELRSDLSSELSKSFVNIQVDVTIAEYRSQKAILSGAYRTPKNIPITEVPITVSEAISLGGSPDDDADLSSFKLIRDGTTHEIDYEYFARTSSLIHDIFIKEDDVLHIPFNDEKVVYVVGEVVKQSNINIRKNNIILSDAIARAGGLSNQTASGSEVYVIRKATDMNEARIFQINLKSPSGFILASKFELLPQDIVYVGPANIARWNRVISQFFPFTTFLNAIDNLQQN